MVASCLAKVVKEEIVMLAMNEKYPCSMIMQAPMAIAIISQLYQMI